MIDLYLPIFISKNMRDGDGDIEMGNVVNRYNSLKDFVINFDKFIKLSGAIPTKTTNELDLQRH